MTNSLAFVIFFGGAFLMCVSAPPLDFLTAKELECFSQEKIYHKRTDKCYKLLTKGPCPRGHWFVLEKPKETLLGTSNTTIRAVCAREMCKEGEYYWSSTRSCVAAKDKKRLCADSEGEELLTNVFGDGECVCTRDPPRARLNDHPKSRCYQLYLRGPCPPAQVFGYSSRLEQAVCLPDPCYAETMYRKRSKTLPKNAVLAPWQNGTCYELGTQGPCPAGLTFKVHPKRMKPDCVSLLNQIFGGIKTCDKDENENCQKKARQRKRSIADRFMKELLWELAKK